MCNLYTLRRTRDELRTYFAVRDDRTGELESATSIYPDSMAPVVRSGNNGERILEVMRWGFPPPPKGDRPVTNVRNVASPFWRPWLTPEHRCLVPFTSFCEWTDSTPKVPHWFARDASRPIMAFAGIWRSWSGTRKGVTGEHLLFSFLTCESNDVIRPIHAKAMPAILTGPDEFDVWLNAPREVALELQRPLPPDALQIVASGNRKDDAA